MSATDAVQTDYMGLVMQELVAVAGDPAATLQNIHDHLTRMWQGADEHTQSAITETWNGFIALQEQAGTAMNLAATARELAGQMQTQRDAALEAHETLASDIRKCRLSNPLVQELYVSASSEAYEAGYQQGIENFGEEAAWNGGHFSYSICEDIISNGEIPVTEEIAKAFFDMLTGDLVGVAAKERQYESLRVELAAFMTAFVAKVRGVEEARYGAREAR